MASITLPPVGQPRRNLIGVALALIGLAVAVVLLSSDPHLLVALSSDRDGEALLPAGTLAPGQSASGRLILANEGVLPLTYTLAVQGGATPEEGPVLMRIRRTDQSTLLYQGSPPRHPITLGRLLPGQHVQMEVTVVAASSNATYSVPTDYTFIWTGRSPGFTAWWWIIPISLLLAVAAFVMPRLLAFAAWLRTRRPQVAERYWRLPLILALVLLAALVPLTGVSLSSVNAFTVNPGNVFAVGALVLSDRSPSGSTCISVTGGTGLQSNQCDAIFRFTNQSPGQGGSAKVTIRNVGTVPVGKFELSTDGCRTVDAPDQTFHGTGDLCGKVFLGVHDDNHDLCYYPVRAAGACPVGPAGTLADFASRYSNQRLQLAADGLGAGNTYTFSVALDPAARSDVQGRTPVINFFWQVSS